MRPNHLPGDVLCTLLSLYEPSYRQLCISAGKGVALPHLKLLLQTVARSTKQVGKKEAITVGGHRCSVAG